MFYVGVVFALLVGAAGFIVLPGFWKFVWVVGWLFALAFVPTALGLILDPINSKRIRSHCLSVGASDVEITPFPNHYGVRFLKDGRKHYARCIVKRGRIIWKGVPPESSP